MRGFAYTVVAVIVAGCVRQTTTEVHVTVTTAPLRVSAERTRSSVGPSTKPVLSERAARVEGLRMTPAASLNVTKPASPAAVVTAKPGPEIYAVAARPTTVRAGETVGFSARTSLDVVSVNAKAMGVTIPLQKHGPGWFMASFPIPAEMPGFMRRTYGVSIEAEDAKGRKEGQNSLRSLRQPLSCLFYRDESAFF